jgi:RNA recognition motif-containing protein
METKLFVGNLAFSTTSEELGTLFAQAGTVASAEVIIDRATGRSRGFAFVQMSNDEEAQKAISMFNGYSLNNREIKVNLARPREDSGRGGGFGGPRRNSGGYGDRGGRGGNYGNRGGGDRRGGSSRY